MKKNNVAKRPNLTNSRKAIRKQKRQEKKLHRQEHYLKKKKPREQPGHSPGRFVKRPADTLNPEEDVKKKKQKLHISSQDIINKESLKVKNETERLKSQMEEQRKKMLLKANEDEDKIIKKLEKQLGLKKSKNKNNFFANDGLDYLLEICDRTTTEQIVAAEKHLVDVEGESDFEEDLATVTGKPLANKNKDNDSDEKSNNLSDLGDEFPDDESVEEFNEDKSGEESNDDLIDGSDFSEDSDSDVETEEMETTIKGTESKKIIPKKVTGKSLKKTDKKSTIKEKVISEDDLEKVFSEDEVSHISGDDDVDDFSDNEIEEDNNKESNEKQKEKPDIWEDIYGRKRDKEGNVIKEEKGIYIPPHLRNKDTISEKELVQLKRQIKSVLNKLAGTNLHWACSSIETLYSNNSRHSVNSAFAQLWLEATVGPATTPDRMLAEHAALVAVLHANVATEIGAHFLQELSKKFDDMLLRPQPVEDKTLDNLVACLAHLYSFKIFHAKLLYDILDRLLDDITEKNIDCVLTALRSVGGVLRKEEPLALKTFIHDTQSKVASLSESAAVGSRIKFLLKVLMAVKNNNLTKIPNYDPTYTEQLKKLTRSVVRKGNYVTTLNVTLEDLLKADERGKWWVVGSAWEGGHSGPSPAQPPSTAQTPSTNQKLLELARKQRMNTDIRRSIFCIVMSAEDYMDAFEKLQHLGLRGQQEREVVHVVMACCLQEKAFNPYYAVLAQKLCDFDRKYQLSIQYSVWDRIKDIENMSKQCMTNLAQFLIHLIMEKGLPLSVLKVIQFSDLNKSSVRFMRQILLSIIMNADLQASLEVFHRISKPPKLHMFRESLKLFIQHFLIKNAGKKNSILSEDEMATLKERTLEVSKILSMYESKLKF